jgi:tetratricopeptide (TPR) repeat protein
VAQRIDREKEGIATLKISSLGSLRGSIGFGRWRKAQSLRKSPGSTRNLRQQGSASPAHLTTSPWDGPAPLSPTRRAEHLLREALERTPTSTRAHLHDFRRLQNRLAESKVELETALARSRNYFAVFRQIGVTMMFMGQPGAAISHIEKGIRLSPYDHNVHVALWALGSCHLLLGHVEEAIELLRRARAIAPGYPNAHLWLAGALALHGDLGEAREALAEAMKLSADFASLARLRANRPYYTNPHFSELAETTVGAGLRAAGMPNN